MERSLVAVAETIAGASNVHQPLQAKAKMVRYLSAPGTEPWCSASPAFASPWNRGRLPLPMSAAQWRGEAESKLEVDEGMPQPYADEHKVGNDDESFCNKQDKYHQSRSAERAPDIHAS